MPDGTKKKGFSFFKKKKEKEEIYTQEDLLMEEDEDLLEDTDAPDGEEKEAGAEEKKNIEENTGERKEAGTPAADGEPASLFADADRDFELEQQAYEAVEGKKFSKKKIAVIAAAAVVVIGGVAYFMVKNISGGDDSKAYVESVGEITGLGSANGMNNRYTGEVEAQDSWKITLESDMSVDKCYVKVGDEVKTGDKLFRYNTEELKLSRDKKKLEIETMENEITQLNKDIATYQEDLDSASASEKIELQTQILTAQTTIKKDEYSIKSGQEELETIESNIKDATVTSKMDGVVKSINESAGESSSDSDDDSDYSYDTTSTDSSYMTILAVGDYRVKGKISETNVWSINEGDAVIVRSRVDEERTWTGSISKVQTDSTTDDDSSSDDTYEDDYSDDVSGESASTYYFYVELEDDSDLMMGQHVFIELDNGQDDEQEGIWLPSAYIKVDGDNYYVWLSDSSDRLKLQKITVGEYDEELDEYQVTDGIDTDDYIACDDTSLKENMKTTKVEPAEEDTESYLDESYYDESDEYYDDESYDEEYDEYYEDEGSDDEIWDESDDSDLTDDSDEVSLESDVDESDDGMDESDVVDLSGESE